MSRKLYVKPPPPTRTMLITQIIVLAFFMPLGTVFAFIAEGEARPFVAIFALIWTTVCIALIVHSVKVLKLIKTGKFEIAEISDPNPENESDFSSRLRNLEALKEDGLISEDEYQKKRKVIMQEKW